VIRRLGVVLLLLTGCGAATTEPTDEQRMEAALLRFSDFPADQGWEIEPTPTADPAQADFDAALEECEQELDPTVETRSADRDSDSFVQGEFVQVDSSASVVPDQAVRDELFEALASMVDCFGSALEDALIAQAGGTLDVEVSEPYSLDLSTEADRTEGHAVQLKIGEARVYVDVAVIEEGPTLLYGAFLHTGELGLEDELEILAPAVQRLKEV
jgi:hypothetical protein